MRMIGGRQPAGDVTGWWKRRAISGQQKGKVRPKRPHACRTSVATPGTVHPNYRSSTLGTSAKDCRVCYAARISMRVVWVANSCPVMTYVCGGSEGERCCCWVGMNDALRGVRCPRPTSDLPDKTEIPRSSGTALHDPV